MSDVLEVENEVKEIQKFNYELEERVKSFQIIDESSLGEANDLLKKIKDGIKKTDALEKSFTKPLNDTIKKIRESLRPQKEYAEKIKQILSDEKIIPYQLEQEKIAKEKAEKEREELIKKEKEERERLLKEAQKSGSEELLDLSIAQDNKLKELEGEVKVDTTVRTGCSTTSMRKTIVGEIVDSPLVPRQYCEPSQKLINEAIKGGLKEIPGVKIYEKTSLISK